MSRLLIIIFLFFTRIGCQAQHMSSADQFYTFDTYYDNGMLYKRLFYSGENQDSALYWYEDGRLMNRIIYVDHETGEELYEHWYPNGRLHQIMGFKLGHQHGEFIEWTEQGTKKLHHFYESGEIVRKID